MFFVPSKSTHVYRFHGLRKFAETRLLFGHHASTIQRCESSYWNRLNPQNAKAFLRFSTQVHICKIRFSTAAVGVLTTSFLVGQRSPLIQRPLKKPATMLYTCRLFNSPPKHDRSREGGSPADAIVIRALAAMTIAG